MQQEVNKITDWATEWKMSINVDKTKCMVISSSYQDQQWNPQLEANGKAIEPVKVYPFLGNTINNNLRFKDHVNKVVTKCTKRNKILKCMATKDWGNSQETQTKLYIQYNRTALEYGSSSWHTWIGKSNMSRLQRVQNEALRTAAGLAKTCPTEFLHAETGVEPLKDRLQKNDMVTYDRYLRQDEQDPRRKLVEKEVTPRLKTRLGWRNTTKPLMEEFKHLNRAPRPKPLPPWSTAGIEFERVDLEDKKSMYSEIELREKAVKKITELEAENILYTDGSTDGNQERGGAGLFVTDKYNQEIHQAQFPAGKLCSSFQAECIAMAKALEWINNNPTIGMNLIVTDSMSMWQALQTNNWKDDDYHLHQIKSKVRALDSKITLLWVPSHCNIEGNERADKLADQGTKEPQEEVPLSKMIMKARIRRKKWITTHHRVRKIYKEGRKPKIELERKWPRKVRSAYNRLRTGHAKQLAYYRYLIEKEDSPECQQCGNGEETTEHLVCHCEQLQSTRERLLIHNPTPDWLVKEPDKCRRLLSERFPELLLNEEKLENKANPNMRC